VLNMEPVSRSVGVGDVVIDTGMISCVDPQPIAIGFNLNVDASFIEPELMPKYDATFGDEQAVDSTDD
jgi:hypothetical protein